MSENRGDAQNFDKNWSHTNEAGYLHWTRKTPENQIQFAFRQHWLTFSELLGKDVRKRKILEVGCGRGSLSAYFADAGWDCTLLDLSPQAITLAETAFETAGLKGRFDVANCENLPYPAESYDVVFSIGLLEHFDDVTQTLSEQYRVLKKGGVFLGYVVPEMPDNVQQEYDWFNKILTEIMGQKARLNKTDVFRSDMLSDGYIPIMEKIGFKEINSRGIYPLPMISNSIEFPFTLLPKNAERILVKQFNKKLSEMQKGGNKNPWLCDEGYGQAFLLHAIK